MAGEENIVDPFDDDQELARAVEQMFQEEEMENERGEDEMMPLEVEAVNATPLESLPGFDLSAGKTWIYPNNMSHRDYQFNIVKSCLFDNTLVCLPTGLGKTFIAAVVMYNFYRWYPQGKVVFMAPTKPLVAQQIQACHKIMGIPQSDMVQMTGNVAVNKRGDAWMSKRVFFLTPQVMGNDLSRGLFPAKEVKLLVVDEAHKAQGEYAYCLVARELNRAGAHTRIVALSATPGADVPSVKQVLQNLFISKIELRHEESEDIVPYTHHRNVDKIVVPLDEDLVNVRNKLLSVQEIYVKKLAAANAVRKGHNPSSYTKFAFLNSRNEWRQNPPGGLPNHVRGQVEADFATVMKLYHGMELLTTQGLRSFHNFFSKENPDDKGCYKRIMNELGRLPAWRDLLEIIGERFAGDALNSRLNSSRPQLSQVPGSSQMRTKTSHPKMDKLLDVTRLHFQRAKEEGEETRVIIFSQFRDCVTELVACLDNERPTIRAMSFIGQAGAQGKKGLTQKDQLEVVKRFKQGNFNTLVATCVGEEGLDIGEVDLIVLYDVASSPIRLVQRMGRTGRKREGRVVVLVTQGREEQKYNQTMCNKNAIHKAIAEQDRLACALWQAAPRMVPLGLDPVCEKMSVVQRAWQGAGSSNKEQRGQRQNQGANSLLSFVNRAKESKDDLFRKNSGFLTEAEEARWEREARWEGGNIKTVGNAGEYWAGRARFLGDHEHRLEEWLDWSEREVGRKFVGEGSVGATFSRIMSKCRSGFFSQPQYRQQTSDVVESEENGVIVDIRQEKKSAKPSSDSPNVKERQSQGSRQGSILSYFNIGTSQKSLTNQVEVRGVVLGKEEHMLPIVLEEDNLCDENEGLVDSEKKSLEILEPAEAELLDSLFDFDSGYDSPTRPTFGNLPRLDNLEPCSKQELDEMMAESRKRYLWPPEEALEVEVFTMREAGGAGKCTEGNSVDMFDLEQDESNNMFPEDSASLMDDNFSAQIQVGGDVADFDLGSPGVEGEDLQIGDLQGNEEMFPDVSQDMFAVSFDLGSPLVEGDGDIAAEEKSANVLPPSPAFDLGSPLVEKDANGEVSPSCLFDLGSPLLEDEELVPEKSPTQLSPSLFDLGSPLLEDEADEAEAGQVGRTSPAHLAQQSAASTPILGSTSAPKVPDIDLTPVASRFARHPFYQGTPMNTPLTRRLMLLKASTPDPRAEKEHSGTQLKMSANSKSSSFKSAEKWNRSNLPLVRTPSPFKNHGRGKTESAHFKESEDMFGEEFKVSEDMFVDDDIFDQLVAGGEEEADVANNPPPRPSFYSASQLVGMLEQSRRSSEKEERGKEKKSLTGVRKKLSNAFNEPIPIEPDICDDVKNHQEPERNEYTEQNDMKEVVSPDIHDVKRSDRSRGLGKKCSTELLERGEDDLRKRPPYNFEKERATELKMSREKKEERLASKVEMSPVRVDMQECPICGKSVEAREINQHVDDCLSVKAIQEISQQAEQPFSNPSSHPDVGVHCEANKSTILGPKEAVSPVIGKRKRSRMVSSSSEGVSPSLLRRSEVDTCATSPVVAVARKKKVILLSSDDESPAKKCPRIEQSNTLKDISNHVEDKSLLAMRWKEKKQRRKNQFLDLEAELSGPDVSGDEGEEGEDVYEQSFVNDDTSPMRDKASTAMYLRSVRSPEQRTARKLAPITDDIFSQAVPARELEEDYEEDSFVVGSQDGMEETGMDDTLDILERRAALPPPCGPPPRRRIAVRPNEDTVQLLSQIQPEVQLAQTTDEEEESMSLLAAAREDQGCDFVAPQSRRAKEDVALTETSKAPFLQPLHDKAVLSQVSMVVHSGEVGRNGEVISQLRHEHKMSVLSTKCEEATFLAGSELAVIRLALVVEWERLKAGEREKSGAKTKQAQLTCSQLAMAGVDLVWSSNQSETASLLANMARLEDERGKGLPRSLKPTQTQEEMTKWLQLISGVSLGSAIVLASSFSSRREIVLASATTLRGKGIGDSLADRLVNFFKHQFRPGLTDMAPL